MKSKASVGQRNDFTNKTDWQQLLNNKPKNLRLSCKRCEKRNSDGTTPPETPKSSEEFTFKKVTFQKTIVR